MAVGATAPAPTTLVLGRYRPVRPLGSGGSGSVWLVRDEASGLEVALKIVARDGKAGARAEREASAAARLRHERCLRAYALAHDDEHVYIAYEYVAGRTLREALRAGELRDVEAVEAAAQVLDGLAHAHARGIVHRDVKPSNVLLADGDEVSVRLLDFGLARMDETQTLTATGDVPGTLAYISPERLAGEPATCASDVWSVGVMLWEALAGGHPFWKPSLLESARAIEAGAPPLVSLRPDLPQALTESVDRALALDARRRPTAVRLAQMLRSVRRERRPVRTRLGVRLKPERDPAAPALAALVAGWSAAALPFYPSGCVPLLAALAALAALVRPRAGLAVALAVPVLPLGNVALALALVYGLVAAAWLALFAREPRGGLLVAFGPLLAPLAALGLLPLAVARLRSPLRRAAAAAGGVLLAGLVAGLRGAPLPFDGEPPPASLGIAASERPASVAGALLDALAAHPALALEAAALAAAAAALPYARARGPWAVAAFGAAFLAVALIPVPGVPAAPLVLAVWATCAVLVLPRVRRGSTT
jgi:predicted Ser/Thr protein kinase